MVYGGPTTLNQLPDKVGGHRYCGGAVTRFSLLGP